uniref:NADH dehydrogenase subunit 6 n=2 Tax=Parascaris TaxID=6254 RepID=A0A915AJ90_PARUN
MEGFFRGSNLLRMVAMLCSVLLVMSLAVAYPVRGVGLSLFIAISSLVLTAAALSLTASNLEHKFASLSFIHTITGNDSDSLRWGHIEFFYCVILCSFHFIGFILNWILSSETLFHLAYSTSSLLSLLLVLIYATLGITALRTDDGDKSERMSLRPDVAAIPEYQQF